MQCIACASTIPDDSAKCPKCGYRYSKQSVLARSEVVIVDVDMPFTSMIGFMVKWAIAAIPALIILAIIFFVLAAAFWGFIAAFSVGR